MPAPALSDSQPSTLNSQPAVPLPSSRPRRGKVARLPKAVRDQLNVMLLDGVPYAQILQNLGEAAAGVTEHNITSWIPGGYQDWLKEQHALEEVRVRQETVMDLACPDGGSKIHEATLQLAATGLAELVRQLNYIDFKELLRDDPAKLIPFLNALARISDAELRCERHRFEMEQLRAKLTQNQVLQKTPGLSPETRQRLEQELNLM